MCELQGSQGPLPSESSMAAFAAALGHPWCAALRGVSSWLRRLGVGGLSEQAYSLAVSEQLRTYLAGLEDDDFTASVLPGAIRFVSAELLHFLAIVIDTEVRSWRVQVPCTLASPRNDSHCMTNKIQLPYVFMV